MPSPSCIVWYAAECNKWVMGATDPYEFAMTDTTIFVMQGRLRQALHWWCSWCDSSFILSIIARGYWFPWKNEAPTPFESKNHAGTQAHGDFTRTAVQDLLRTGAAAEAPDRAALSCVSPLNVVEQREKCRLILDLRKVNEHLCVPKFKYEGLLRVAELIKPNDWMFSVDLKSGYHHVDIHPTCWRYLGFQFDGAYYYFRSLPFGLATAPFVFTQLIKQLARRWRARGWRVIPYVDDILVLSESAQQARSTCTMIVQDLKDSGLVINKKKSQLLPTQALRFLGLELDTRSGTFSVGDECRSQLKSTMATLITEGRRGRQVHIRHVALVTGMLASMSLALGATARAFSHKLLQTINTAPSWNSRISLSSEAIDELGFWMEQFDKFNGAPFHQPHQYDAVIQVDASAHSWGATFVTFRRERSTASASMPSHLPPTSSTRRELEGVLWSLRTFMHQIQGGHTLVRVDNQGVMFILRKGGSSTTELTLACKEIISLCTEHSIRLAIEWIPRELNTHADELSKLQDHDDYTLKQHWFRLLERRWGPHSIDLFANARNALLPCFCSKVPNPKAEAVNAFSTDWSGEHGFAFPPPHLIPATLRHAQRTHAKITLVIPQWTGAAWWPLVQPSPQTWAKGITSHLALASGSQCLHPGTHLRSQALDFQIVPSLHWL
ncbi:unnamed protein product [Closterium sp. NIES-53]